MMLSIPPQRPITVIRSGGFSKLKMSEISIDLWISCYRSKRITSRNKPVKCFTCLLETKSLDPKYEHLSKNIVLTTIYN